MALHQTTHFLINKQDLATTRMLTAELDDNSVADGDVLLKIDNFGLSANNITYAALGEKMGYWGFFSPPGGEGVMPVWGFATIVASRHPQLQAGEKVYGFLPFASHLIVRPGKVSNMLFSDVSASRNSIHPVYDQYRRCAADPAYQADAEVWQMNFQPLFMTAFVLDEAVSAYASHTIVVTSASAKTALGTAFLLNHHRQSRQANYRIIGLTSSSNMDFTRSFGCYDEVISYADHDTLHGHSPVIVLDFAGNGELLASLESQLGSAFETLRMIGATDWEATKGTRPQNVDASLFFAPEHVAHLQKQWGTEAFMQRYAKAWQGFCVQLDDHFSIVSTSGQTALQQLYLDQLHGAVSPQQVNQLHW